MTGDDGLADQRFGALMGSLTGAVLGALLVGLLGVIAFSEPSSALTLAGIGAAFGAAAAAIYWSGGAPDESGAPHPAAGGPDRHPAGAWTRRLTDEQGDVRAGRR